MDKIKILYIGLSPNFGGIERFLINVCKNIDRNKFEISFLIFKGKKVCCQEELEKLGIKFLEITHRKKNYVKFLKELKTVFTNHDFDYIHFNLVNFKCPERILFANKYSRAKIILHSHNALLKNFELTHYVGKFLIRKIECIRLACGEEAGKFLFGDKSFRILNNGMDLRKFEFNQENRNEIRNEIKVSEKDVVIGLIAKLEEQKNHSFLINVFEEYQKLNQASKLILIGEGSLKDKLVEQVKQLGIQDKVLFLGRRNDTEKIYSAMDIFVMPSWFEGFSIAIAEAQANGLKCYTSKNVSEESNIIGNVEFLSLDENAEFWAKRIFQEENKREQEAINKIPNQFKIEETVKILSEIYSEGD